MIRMVVGLLLVGAMCVASYGAYDALVGPSKANGACELQIIEQNISVVEADRFRRFCMRSLGYSWKGDCMVAFNTQPGCFAPTWMWWNSDLF